MPRVVQFGLAGGCRTLYRKFGFVEKGRRIKHYLLKQRALGRIDMGLLL
jgi:hypothetical protein